MKLLFKIVILYIILNFCHGRTAENLKIRIQDGEILGRYMSSNSGKTIRAFMGIPFAAPPIGNLRFKEPQKPASWTGVLNVQNPPPMCTQTNMILRGDHTVMGQEDCLYLNVYAPEIKSKKKLPVMVWIHGGGWTFGYSTTPFYGPEYLLDHDVILVSGNYRLGALGFLSTEDEHCPGNMGFKDQVMVLKWVQDNIEQFGGDKNSVTIFGESAGGASVTLLMNSPKASKLFHRAIAHSGSLMSMWSQPQQKGLAKSRAVELAGMVGCSSSSSSSKAILKCLRNVPAENLIKAIYKFFKWDYDPIIPFGVVIEDANHSEDPFLTDAIYKKSSSEIPLMVGVNSEEGLFKAVGMLNNPALLKDLEDNWRIAFPATFYYDYLPKQQQDEISAAIYDFYFKNGSISDNLDKIQALFTDGLIVFGTIENLQQRLKIKKHTNTYVYLFSHKGSASSTEWLGGDPEKFYGTCHLDELLYLFPMREHLSALINSIPSKEDLKLKDLMTKMWTNFARKGNPTSYDDFNLPYWLPASEFPLDYMRIGNNNGYSSSLLKMKSDLFSERANFWINLKKKYNLGRWIV